MKKTKIIISLILLILLCSCNDYEKVIGSAIKKKMEDPNSNPIFDGTPEPSIPNIELNNQTLLGVDTNNNRLRDDIEIWINRTGENYNERMALKQYALAVRESMLIGEKIYMLHLKGPVNMQVESEASYSLFLGEEVQRTSEQQADAAMGCMSMIFINKDSKKYKYFDDLRYLFTNTDLRKKAEDSYYTYNHIYKVSKNLKNDLDHCDFKVEERERLNSDYEQLIKANNKSN